MIKHFELDMGQGVEPLALSEPMLITIDLSEFSANSLEPEKPGLLGLREADGYKLKYDAPAITEDKIKEIGGQKFVEAKDLLGKAGGRIHEWKLKANIASSRERKWQPVRPNEFRDGHVAIVGSGPSIGQISQIKELRALQKKGVKVHAINRCHDFLLTKGIVPFSASLLDPIPQVATYIKPQRGVRYEIGSQCDPKTFDAFDKPNVDKYIWHAKTTTRLDRECFTPEEDMWAVPSRTSTNGLRSILLKYLQGFRHIHLFGFDSSYETYIDKFGEMQIKLGKDGNGKLHAHAKPEAIHDIRQMRVVEQNENKETIYEREYLTNSAMLGQAHEFCGLISDIAHGIRDGFMDQIFLYVHGDGLIPDLACSKKYRLHFDRKRNREYV